MAALTMLAFSMPVAALAETKLPIPLPLKKAEPELKKDLAHLIPYSTQLAERYTDLQGRVAELFQPAEVHEKLVELSEKLEDLGWEIRFLKSAGAQSYSKVPALQAQVSRYDAKIKEIRKPVSKALQELAAWKNEWTRERERLPEWRTAVSREISYNAVEKTFKNIEQTITGALGLIAHHLKPMLAADQQIGELQVRIHTLNARLNELTQIMNKGGFRKKAPSMFSQAFYKQFDKQLWDTTWTTIKTFVRGQGRLFNKRIGTILLMLFIWMVLAIGIARSGRLLEEAKKWQVFNERPVATGLFLLLTLSAMVVSPLPIVWEPVMKIGIIVAVMRLAAGLVQHRWEKRLVGQLAVLLLVAAFFRVVSIPFPVLRLFSLTLALLALLFCLGQSRKLRTGQKSSLLRWGLRLVAFVLVAGLVAGIIGYAAFALYLLDSSLKTLFVVLVVWMLYLLASGVTEAIFFKSPIGMMRRNASVLVQRVQPLELFSFAGLLLLYTLEAWQVFPTKANALSSIVSLGVTMGSSRITIGTVMVAAAVLYVALMTSRALQAVLLQEVLPRRSMELGAQLSISRLVHYAIISIGFLLALHSLGFSLTNLTIIGGALGVGIGFGLQAIVNNFASGLILLFERPIKVGDTIQVGDEMAEVKHLGLRSTVIETYDNAEIVVPNSDLITNQVINWTLTERQVRLKLPVGVAYGSDVARVMGILMSCANEHEQVLKEPAPQVLFLEFGDSALNFELRVWISDFNNRRMVQSELNQAIDIRFRRAGIEIPFPQTDLHLRSVDEPAAAALNPAPVQGKPLDEPAK
jgi:small-conductance mechanosensitive channel